LPLPQEISIATNNFLWLWICSHICYDQW
jgi:hypothetical protein